MEIVIALLLLALATGVAYGIRRKSRPTAYVCPDCGERHCQCRRED